MHSLGTLHIIQYYLIFYNTTWIATRRIAYFAMDDYMHLKSIIIGQDGLSAIRGMVNCFYILVLFNL